MWICNTSVLGPVSWCDMSACIMCTCIAHFLHAEGAQWIAVSNQTNPVACLCFFLKLSLCECVCEGFLSLLTRGKLWCICNAENDVFLMSGGIKFKLCMIVMYTVHACTCTHKRLSETDWFMVFNQEITDRFDVGATHHYVHRKGKMEINDPQGQKLWKNSRQ